MVYQYDKHFGYGYWMTSISTISHICLFLGYSEFPSWLPWQPIQISQYPKSIQQNIKVWDMVQILVIQQPYPKFLSKMSAESVPDTAFQSRKLCHLSLRISAYGCQIPPKKWSFESGNMAYESQIPPGNFSFESGNMADESQIPQKIGHLSLENSHLRVDI